jgi:hypothetical protein
MEKLLKKQIEDLALKYELTYADVKAIVDVESGGIGFATDTGKIIIQFEPSWFKRKSPYTPSGLWSQNGVERQSKEWIAFNDAFAKNPNAAMQSTSIGLMQVMGFHYAELGFKTVGEMWDFAKISEANQLELGLKFIKSDIKMYNALKTNDFAIFAYHYNGSQYKKFNYDKRIEIAHKKALTESI